MSKDMTGDAIALVVFLGATLYWIRRLYLGLRDRQLVASGQIHSLAERPVQFWTSISIAAAKALVGLLVLALGTLHLFGYLDP